MPAHARSNAVDSLPTQREFADRLRAQALTGGLQFLFGHDLVGAIAYVAERGGVSHRVVHVQQQQSPDLRRFLLALDLLLEIVLIGLSLGLVFQLLHVIAQGIHEVIGELPVALPRVA
jgi:hypothetical protein